MTRYERVQQILDEAIGGPDVNIGVHGAFWRGLTRDQFVTKKVFNLDLVVVGSGSAANLVKSLKGEAPCGADICWRARLPQLVAGINEDASEPCVVA